MANPFLMTDDDIGVAKHESYSNPFLMTDAQDDYGTDNPFLGQATNPFAGFGENTDDMPPTATNEMDIFGTNDMVVTTGMQIFLGADPSSSVTTTAANTFQPTSSGMNFFDTSVGGYEGDTALQKPHDLDIKPPAMMSAFDDSNYAYSSDDEISKMKKKPPPPRPVLPPKATQDLILSVADQLDMASSHLLGRIPATRTPSPISMRDLHSPSPTPDNTMGDLLDVSESKSASSNPQDIFEADLMSNEIDNDNPFVESNPIPKKNDVNKNVPNHPSRPPPPRPIPPPKPIPPAVRPMTTPHVPPTRPAAPAVQAQPDADFIDIFGTEENIPLRPPAPKSNQDILSLFSVSNNNITTTTTTVTQPDLLSDDIPELDGIPDAQLISNVGIIHDIGSNMNQMVNQPVNDLFSSDTEIQSIQNESENIYPSAVYTPPEPELTALPNLADQDIKMGDEIKSEILSEYNDVSESNFTITELPQSKSDNIGNIDMAIVEEPVEEMEAELVQEYPTSNPANPFASPTEEERANEPLYEVMETIIAPQFVPRPIPPRPQVPPPRPQVPAPVSTQPAIIPEPVPIVPESIPIVTQQTVVESAPVPVSLSGGFFDLDDLNEPAAKPASDTFDAFSAKFDSVKKEDSTGKINIFLDDAASTISNGFEASPGGDAWGDNSTGFGDTTNQSDGFGTEEEGFDSFLALNEPPARESTPYDRNDSRDSDEGKEFNVVIRPKEPELGFGLTTPVLAPPPKSSQNSIYSGDSSPRLNPFDKGFEDVSSAEGISAIPEKPPTFERTDSQETPPTPLFDEDVSQPLEDFPRVMFNGTTGWQMQLRQPNKKKITGQRFWKPIFIRLVFQGDNPVMQLFNAATDKEPFQELPLQACYSVSDIGAQQFDQYGKIFTIKLQYIFYKERPGVRPGQVTKAERLTNKLSQFAAYAIQGDYQGVKEFGSDLKKLGLPVEHAPQVCQLFKIGSMNFEDMKQFSVCVEEALFKLNVHRDRSLKYKSEEVQITAVDELYVEQDAEGHILKQIARVRLFFLGFLSGMPSIELGVNDLWRQGKEVVGRHDIIPVVTEEWIRLEGVEFHNCVQQDEYEKSRTIKFQPPDACYIELMRFRVRPPKNRELPLQIKATWCVTGNKVELRVDVLVPGFASRKLGQIPCEDVALRFPIPECWIYLFRVEKHFRYGSVKSAHRRTGKIKGIERILGTVDALQESLIEVTSGQAKYEHHHRAIVWRCPRLPKEGQGAYTTHQMVCRMALTSFDQIPEQLAPYCYVEFTMPATQVSHTTVRSVSVQESDSDDPPEKYVRYLARHEYKVGIEHTQGENPNAYLAATSISKTVIKEEPAVQVTSPMAPSDSDSDSN